MIGSLDIETLGKLVEVPLLGGSPNFIQFFGVKLHFWLYEGDASTATFEKTMAFFADARKDFAHQISQPNSKEFGQPRIDDRHTEILPRYSVYEERAYKFYEEASKGRFASAGIPLTRISKSSTDTESLVCVHTNPEQIVCCTEKMKEAWGLVNCSDEEEAAKKAVAEFHWWGAHAMPYERGSACIVDATLKFLQLRNGIRVANWNHDISPDCEALVMTRDEFVEGCSGLSLPID